jgi:outer membrane receptor protein involved in Fe transport
MRKIIGLVLLILITHVALAQMPGGMRPGGGGQAPTGRFYGKVVDGNRKAVEAASVTLVTTRMDSATRQPKEVIIGGMLTAANGDFSLENIPLMGRYKLRITGIGYQQYEAAVAFEMPNRNDPSAMIGALDKDLGNIRLNVDDKVLGSVTVTATRPQLQLGVDRKIFNVDRNITSAGGTAIDVMRQVPSVNVDVDGNVTLRNAPPQVFVDGRPTNLTLEQIPADAIESIEIITNPSAKFDASGGVAGILNVVLKKNKRVGYSGNLRANIDSRARFGLGGDINVRQEKVNVFLNGNYNQRKSIATGQQNRITRIVDTTFLTNQTDRNVTEGSFAFVRGGLDYFINNRNTITVSGSYVRGMFEPININQLTNTVTRPSGSTSNYNERITDVEGNFRNLGAQLSYKFNFPKAGKELTSDFTFNSSRNNNGNLITSSFFPSRGGVKTSEVRQRQEITGENQNYVFQIDFVNPINDKTKLEMGARSNMRKIASVNNFFQQINGGEQLLSQLSSDFNSTENVHAAYVTLSRQQKNFNYQLGLRAESSIFQGTIPGKNQSFETSYPFSLFPSVFLSQKLNNGQDLQLNYSRRINRPNFFQLFPFLDLSDSLNIQQGNPALQPEFTNSIEVSYSKLFENKDNFLATVYFKNTNALISRFQQPGVDSSTGKPILINTFINANRSYITGLEMTTRNKITKWWDINANVNLFISQIQIDIPGQPQQEALASGFAKLNNTFRLPKNFTLQLSGDYQSRTILPAGGGGRGGFGGGFGGGPQTTTQGFIRPNYGVDAALRFEFLKNKTASISLNVQDIFRTRVYDAFSFSPFFEQNVSRRRDPQLARINFNWRFGKFDAALFKRKNTRADGNIDMGGGL